MKVFLVSYAKGRFLSEQACLVASAIRCSVTDFRSWNEEMLRETAFYSQQKTILEMKRGAGYWLWKPFIIIQTLVEMQEGDCLIYCDSGIEIIADLTPLLRIAFEKQGVMLFRGHGRCREWTKRDFFFYMSADDPAYHEAQMLDASFLLMIKTRRACAFAGEWLQSCKDRRILTDDSNTCGLPNLPGFVDHRHDQSVLSVLAKRENFELFRAPSQFGDGDKVPEPREATQPSTNSPYGTLLNHHRGWTRVHAARSVDASGHSILSLQIPRALILEKFRKPSS